MYEKIMVPLDGSELAECVLPHVEAFIKGCHVSNVVFVRVVEATEATYHGEFSINPEILEERDSARKSSFSRSSSRVHCLSHWKGVCGLGTNGETETASLKRRPCLGSASIRSTSETIPSRSVSVSVGSPIMK